MIVKLQKAFGHIQFFSDTHTYINTETGESLPSVTKYIKQFQPEFKKDYWLGVKAKERGITKDELDKEWRWKAKIAVEMGGAVHAFLEQKVQRRHIVPEIPNYLDQEKYRKLIAQAEEYVKTITEPVIACEFVMCNQDGTLAGMCDCLHQGEKGIILRDYKTGQLKRAYRNHKKPYEFLDDSSLGKYSLQLNVYRSFLENAGFPVEKLEIIYFNETNPSFEVHDIPKFEIT